MRLTKTDRYGHFYTNKANCRNIWSLDGKKLEGELLENQTLAIDGEAINKLGQLEDIEEKLGFGLNELVQMLIDGVWEVGGVDSKTMKPEPSCLLFYYVYGIDFKNKCLKVMRATGYNERSIERSREFVFSSLHLCKYKKKCLGGWALTKEELEK